MENSQIVATVQPPESRMVKSVVEVQTQVALLREVLEKIMIEGTDYGAIKGCGPKPTLLKPGAEKLCVAFRIAPEIHVEDLSGVNEEGIAHKTFRVKVRGIHIGTGALIGEGIGECSTLEEKYAWKESGGGEWDNAPETHRRVKSKKVWRDGVSSFVDVKQIRTNPADQANTVLKMAKKRGLVDMALTSTGASGLLDQDLEEQEGAQVQPAARRPTRPQAQRSQQNVQSPAQPQQNAAEPSPEPPAEDPSGGWSPDQESGPTEDQQIDGAEQNYQGGSESGGDGGPDFSSLPLDTRELGNWKGLMKIKERVLAKQPGAEKLFWNVATASKDPKYKALNSQQEALDKIHAFEAKSMAKKFIYVWLCQAREGFKNA